MKEINGTIFGNNNGIDIEKVTWGINHDEVTGTSLGYLESMFISFADGNYIGCDSDAILAVVQSTDGVNAIITTDISEEGFYNNEGKAYENIVIAEGVASIGAKAFYNTTAKTITLPSTITSIGKNAFKYSSTNIGTVDLRNVAIGDYALSSVTMENCVVTEDQIKDGVIENTVITNLYLDYDGSALLTSSDTDGCQITNVYFIGSESDWTTFINDNADSNSPLVNANISYNAEMP